MVLSPLITILLWTSRARMCRAPVQPSTISSIRTPSWMWKITVEIKYTKTLNVPIKKPQVAVGLVTHHKLLLVASHAGAPLGVLVSPDQQLHQSGDGSLLPQSAMIGWAKSQVADQTNCGLDRGEFNIF